MKDLIDREVVLEELSCTRPSPKDRPKYLQWLADNKAILEVPLVQSDCDEWCTDCKEYDVDNHCCPRFNKVIREALKEAQPERDIPIKPIETTDKAWGIPRRQAVCPKCDYYLGHVAFLGDYKGKRVTYCETCGQAIDWEGWYFDG